MILLTDRAKDVIELARREAQDLRHNRVGTEHVLLGILREGGGIAKRLTDMLQLKVNLVRKGVSMLNPAATTAWVSQTQLPFSDRLRSALKVAEGVAQKCGHEGIGIAHLFLGLTEDEQAKASLLLMNLGLDLKETRREMLEALSRPSDR